MCKADGGLKLELLVSSLFRLLRMAGLRPSELCNGPSRLPDHHSFSNSEEYEQQEAQLSSVLAPSTPIPSESP